MDPVTLAGFILSAMLHIYHNQRHNTLELKHAEGTKHENSIKAKKDRVSKRESKRNSKINGKSSSKHKKYANDNSSNSSYDSS